MWMGPASSGGAQNGHLLQARVTSVLPTARNEIVTLSPVFQPMLAGIDACQICTCTPAGCHAMVFDQSGVSEWKK